MRIKNLICFLVLIIASLFPLADLFHSGMFVSHDGQDHIARFANFYQSLSEGNLIPRWAANLNWGYGHPILTFLYPLPSYLASFFHFLGFSLVDSVKFVFGLAFILSGFTMYLWIQEFLGKKAGLVGALFYMFAPYRFVDLYVRGAIGEHVFFVFPPLVLLFLLKLSQESKWKYVVGGSLSLAGLILSHNALSLMFLPVVFAYVIFLFWQTNIDKKLFSIKCLLLNLQGFALSAFFWLPAFFEGRYTLRDIVTAGDYSSRFVSLKNLLYSPWSFGGTGQLSAQVGVVQWIVATLGAVLVIYLLRKRNQYWIFSLGLLFFFFFSLFLMTSASLPVWQQLKILQKFQFPWRFLSLSIFSPAIIAGFLIHFAPKRLKYLMFFGLSILVIFANKDYWHARGFIEKPENFYSGVYEGTTDTGESSPRWSVRFMEKKPSEALAVIDGEAAVEQKKRLSNAHLYNVDVKVKSRLVENTLYFPGWEILVDNQRAEVEFQDQNWRGLQTIYVGPGKHWILVHFIETRLRKFADIISLIAIFALFIPLVLQKTPLTE